MGVSIVSVSRSALSSVLGYDSSVVQFSSDAAFTDYEVRVVPDGSSDRSVGTVLEGGALAGVAGTAYAITITEAELAAAGAEGNNTVKIFVRQANGNWSDGVALLTSPAQVTSPTLLTGS